MLVDRRALVAILTPKPERERFLRLMAVAPIGTVGAPSPLEACIVVHQ
jgi:uncharacterized protein with PIN domain